VEMRARSPSPSRTLARGLNLLGIAAPDQP